LERLHLAALRLREIQNEAAAIYRRFPELDHRPKSVRRYQPRTSSGREARTIAWPAKLH
jgi:hypothetical protein